MKYGDSRGIKTRQWFTNEILRQEDINRIGLETYQNIVDSFLTMSNFPFDAEALIAEIAPGDLNMVFFTTPELLEIGDEILVRPGGRIPADGVVVVHHPQRSTTDERRVQVCLSAEGLALQRLEVRAFGCLLEELLARCEAESSQLDELHRLSATCLCDSPAERPDFAHIERVLAAARG